jgi:hypothetical protein
VKFLGIVLILFFRTNIEHRDNKKIGGYKCLD